jgi:hypothetical protein
MNEDHFWKAFETFFVWGIEAWMLPPILVVGLISLSIVIAVYSFRRVQVRAQWQPAYWFVFTQLLFYPFIIGVAAGFQGVLRGPEQSARTNTLGDHLLQTLLYGSFVTGSLWIYRMKGSAGLPLDWLSFKKRYCTAGSL